MISASSSLSRGAQFVGFGGRADADRNVEAVSPRLAREATTLDLEPGTPLFWQGDVPSRVFFISSGRAKLMRNASGRELIIGIRCPASFLGATDALLGREHPFSAQTLTRCRLLQLSAAALSRVAQADHDFCLHLLRSELQEMSEELDNASGVGCLGVRERLERYLRRLVGVEPTRGPVRVELPLRHWELAQLLAITPEHLSRVLRELESDGLLERRRGWLVLPDPSRLAHSQAG